MRVSVQIAMSKVHRSVKHKLYILKCMHYVQIKVYKVNSEQWTKWNMNTQNSTFFICTSKWCTLHTAIVQVPFAVWLPCLPDHLIVSESEWNSLWQFCINIICHLTSGWNWTGRWVLGTVVICKIIVTKNMKINP